MKREIIKLVGGIPSVVPTSSHKPLGKYDRVTKWVWTKFNNPARTDKFQFSHWQREEDVDKDYEYAQFNKKIKLVEFTQEEYENLIKELDPSWSFEETVYLWDLCKQFDLRFPIIHDRYDWHVNRTIEELKDRYYSISRRILVHKNIHDHPILKSGYNYEQEMKRRAYLEKTINKSKEDVNVETELLKQADELEKKIEKFEKTENLEKNLLEDKRNEIIFEDFIKSNANQGDSFVYLRSDKMKYSLPICERLQKKVEILLKELNIPEKLIPTTKVEETYDNLRINLILLTSLKKHADKKEREMSALTQKLYELQSKLQSQRINNLPHSITSHPSMIPIGASSVVDNTMDGLSVSSTGREKSKKIINPNKIRKVKYIIK